MGPSQPPPARDSQIPPPEHPAHECQQLTSNKLFLSSVAEPEPEPQEPQLFAVVETEP